MSVVTIYIISLSRSLLIISDIDYCAEMPCQNNGTCIDLLNDYNCICMDGFNGANCTNSKLQCILVRE